MSITKDCIITVKEPWFSGSYRKPQFEGYRTYTGMVVKESYGQDKGQHTFTIEIISGDLDHFAVGKTIKRKGRNIYPNIMNMKTPNNYKALCTEKEERRPDYEMNYEKFLQSITR
jgi:hypothetical protein